MVVQRVRSRRVTRLVAALAAGLLLLLAGCDGSSTRPDLSPEVVRFDYDGAVTGSFDANGVILAGTNIWGERFLTANQTIEAGRIHHSLHITLPAVRVGTFNLHHRGTFAMYDYGREEYPSYYFTGGTITISSVERGRIQGSFAGVMVGRDEAAGRQLVIRNGVFNTRRMGSPD